MKTKKKDEFKNYMEAYLRNTMQPVTGKRKEVFEDSMQKLGLNNYPAINTSAPKEMATPNAPMQNSNPLQPKYAGNDFAEWYKKNYGADYQQGYDVDYSKVSGQDAEIGRNLYNGMVAKQQLQASEDQAKQKLDIIYRTAQKYLPYQIQSLGMQGQGVAGTLGVEMANNYANNLNDVNNQYSRLYAGLEADTNDANANVMEKYNQLAMQQDMIDKQSAKDIMLGQYMDLLQTDENGQVSEENRAKAEKMLTENKELFGDREYNAYLSHIQGMKTGETSTTSISLVDEKGNKIENSGYTGSGSNGKQDKYFDIVKNDFESGRIPVGAIVSFNYGAHTNNQGYYEVVNVNGKKVLRKTKGNLTQDQIKKIYLPSGYKLNALDDVVQD